MAATPTAQQARDAAVSQYSGQQYTPGASTLAQQNNTTLMIHRGGFRAGDAFPEWWGSSATVGDIAKNLGSMSAYEILQLKKRLWFAGYYESTNGKPMSTPDETPIADSNLTAAMKNLVSETLSYGGQRSLDEVLTDRESAMAPVRQKMIAGDLDVPGVMQKMKSDAVELIGRELTDDELVGLVHKAFSSDKPGASGAPAANVLWGGGPDSTAIRFGREMGSAFGLAPVQEYTTNDQSAPDPAYKKGLGVTLSGGQNDLKNAYDWAKTQEGQGGTFAKVEYETDYGGVPVGLHLVMNEGVLKPAIGGRSDAATADQTAEFLRAARRDGDGVLEYNWQGEGPHRRGAYGVSDEIWNYYTSQMGIDPHDTSSKNQDEVARRYAQDLYKRYGNWRDVAVALRTDENTAWKFHNGDGAPPPEDEKWSRDVLDRMARPERPATGYSGLFGADGKSLLFDRSTILADGTDGMPYDPATFKAGIQRQFQQDYATSIAANRTADAVLMLLKAHKAKSIDDLLGG